MVMREAKGFEEGDAKFRKFEAIGDRIEGKLVNVKPSEKYGKIYTVQSEGENWLVLGKKQLNLKMEEVPVGSMVVLEYVEAKKTEKGTLKLFKVMYDDGTEESPETPHDPGSY